jgi:O-antigen/teichoic acid export membrane protein
VAYWLGWLVYLIYIFYKTKIDNINRFSLAELKTTFKKYKHFPLYHAIPTVISSFTLSIPVFYFNQYFSENEIGWFNFARQTLLIPVTLMATAVAQVYFGRVVEMARAKQYIMPSYLKLKAVFALLAIAMIFMISFYGSELFSIVFGANWIQSGQYSKYLVVSAGLQLLVWPLNIIPIALGKIKQNSGFQIIHFILIGLIFLIQPKNPTSAIHYLIAIDVLFFLAYGLFIFYCVKNNDQRLQAI